MFTFFHFDGFENLVSKLEKEFDFQRGKFSLERFSNDELHISLGTNPKEKTCVILGSISPPEEHLISFLLLAHTLKKEGAKKVIALIPYLSYTRHEHDELLKSLAADLLGKLFETSGIDEIITIDIHSQKAQSLFGAKVKSLSPLSLIAKELNHLNFHPKTIVAPDEGARIRAQILSEMLKIKYVVFHKTRDEKGINHVIPQQSFEEPILIIDDMLDTGETLLSCIKNLKSMGKTNIAIAVTHGLFTKHKWEELFKLNLQAFITTSSIEHKKSFLNKYHITELSLFPLIKEALCQI